jgi:hypothetical protein
VNLRIDGVTSRVTGTVSARPAQEVSP